MAPLVCSSQSSQALEHLQQVHFHNKANVNVGMSGKSTVTIMQSWKQKDSNECKKVSIRSSGKWTGKKSTSMSLNRFQSLTSQPMRYERRCKRKEANRTSVESQKFICNRSFFCLFFSFPQDLPSDETEHVRWFHYHDRKKNPAGQAFVPPTDELAGRLKVFRKKSASYFCQILRNSWTLKTTLL